MEILEYMYVFDEQTSLDIHSLNSYNSYEEDLSALNPVILNQKECEKNLDYKDLEDDNKLFQPLFNKCKDYLLSFFFLSLIHFIIIGIPSKPYFGILFFICLSLGYIHSLASRTHL